MKQFVLLAAVAVFAFSTGVYAQSVFTDVPTDHWAKSSIEWVNERGIMTGPSGPEARFDPEGLVNRAQMATVLTRMNSQLEADIEALELRLAQLEYQGFLVEELLNGPNNQR